MGELEVAIRLPEKHRSADRLRFDFLDGSFCRRRPLISNHFAVLHRRRPICLPGRIPDMFDGQKRAARKAKGKMRALLGFWQNSPRSSETII
jgi:hypothetical protein